jgi:pimeloyl-ACP methyl ester carboxylesterase
MPLREYTGIGGRVAPIRAARDAGDDYGATAQPDWRKLDWLAHLHRLPIRGRSVNYVDVGESKHGQAPVVFIHGLGGCWQNWLENIPRVAEERRTIALDLPGFAFSEMPAEDISIANYARTVVELMDAVGIDEPAVLVGNSMGGFIGAEIGIKFADRCRQIALVSAAGISVNNVRRRPVVTGARVLAATTNMVLARRESLVKRPASRHALLAYVFRHPTRIKPDLAYNVMHGAGSPGFLGALEACLNHDFRDRLGDVKCPTLLIWGTDDNLVPVEDADEYERLIPNARKVILEDTGHVPMLERPQTFNDLLMGFIAEPGAEPAPASAAGLHQAESA